ncbi:terminase small subunit [Christensenellaceae bacterium OttesenSCG-928-L17]|nr:terminase small subunit [Christensenellaceae bacterium OttesenSCG-928-L17]
MSEEYKAAIAALTDKERLFVEEYQIDLCKTQAVIRAGYQTSDPVSYGYQLSNKPSVKKALEIAMADRSKRTGVNQDRVVRELAKIAFANAPDIINMLDASLKDGADVEDTAAIASVKVKITSQGVEREIKLADKNKALEQLGKHLGMYPDKLTFANALPVQIVDDIPKDDAK